MEKQEIIKAYLKIREIDNTIPDDVLDFMKDAAIDKLKEKAFTDLAVFGEAHIELPTSSASSAIIRGLQSETQP